MGEGYGSPWSEAALTGFCIRGAGTVTRCSQGKIYEMQGGQKEKDLGLRGRAEDVHGHGQFN